MPEQLPDDYDGPAMLTVNGETFAVAVRVASRFEPVDGRFHSAGRIAPHDAVLAHVRAGVNVAELTIDGARMLVQLKDLDPWGGVRLQAVGPFSKESP